MQAQVDAACAAVAARLAAGQAPRGTKWWKDGVYAYWCDQCDYNSPRKHNLGDHMRNHSGCRPFACEHCDKTFRVSSSLIEHRRIHSESYPFTCVHCDKRFKSAINLSKHAPVHNASRPRPFSCELCAYRCTSSSSLVRHARSHTESRPHTCERCDKQFKSANDLSKHARIHVDARAHTCTKCVRAFNRADTLATHMYTHTGPFCSNPDCNVSYRVIVKNEKDICGFCALGFKFGAKERTVFATLIDRDARFSHFVRDKAMGCGTRRRPDAYADLHISCENVLFVIECDEFAHRGNTPRCELTRLDEIQAAHGGALYVVRINPDAPYGLSADNLEWFAERCVEILDTDHAQATATEIDDTVPHVMHHPGRVIEYWGYKPARLERLRAEFTRIQSGQ
jgi:hypothetical protein